MKSLLVVFVHNAPWIVLVSKESFNSIEAIVLASGKVLYAFTRVDWYGTSNFVTEEVGLVESDNDYQ